MPSNTTYNPPNIYSFTKTALLFSARGISTTVTAGSSANLDITMTDDCLLTGVELITEAAAFGDTLTLQVLDPTKTVVLETAASNWYISSTSDQQFEMVYPAKILAGLTLRVIYTSVGTSNVFLAINYKLHTVLI
jgi:hypothetical protein